MHQSEGAREALIGLDDTDLEGLATRDILRQARSLQDWPPASLPDALIERLTKGEAILVQDIARQTGAPGQVAECARTLKLRRVSRDAAAVQREIDRLQESGVAGHEHEFDALWERKIDLLQRLDRQ